MQNDIADIRDDVFSPEETRAVIKTRFAPKNPIWRSLSFTLIHCILTPIARVRCLIHRRHAVEGQRKLRGYKRSGYFLYGALPEDGKDRVIPLTLCDPKHIYTIVPSREKGGRTDISPWRLFCGDIPSPATAADTRAFLEAVEKRAVERGAIVVYPSSIEGVDPALDPFSFPARFDEPAFCFSTVTEATEDGKARTVTYLDGPFYAKDGLSLSEQSADLRTRITERMTARHTAAKDGRGV